MDNSVSSMVKGRVLSGEVVSTKMDKTITVEIQRRFKSSLYGKYIARSKKYHVHDPDNVAQIGDLVTIYECRPLSRTKSWALLSIDRKMNT